MYSLCVVCVCTYTHTCSCVCRYVCVYIHTYVCLCIWRTGDNLSITSQVLYTLFGDGVPRCLEIHHICQSESPRDSLSPVLGLQARDQHNWPGTSITGTFTRILGIELESSFTKASTLLTCLSSTLVCRFLFFCSFETRSGYVAFAGLELTL